MRVGFQWTPIETAPFFLVIKVSRKEIWPLFSVSMVKDILGSTALRVSWNLVTECFLIMKKLSST